MYAKCRQCRQLLETYQTPTTIGTLVPSIGTFVPMLVLGRNYRKRNAFVYTAYTAYTTYILHTLYNILIYNELCLNVGNVCKNKTKKSCRFVWRCRKNYLPLHRSVLVVPEVIQTIRCFFTISFLHYST